MKLDDFKMVYLNVVVQPVIDIKNQTDIERQVRSCVNDARLAIFVNSKPWHNIGYRITVNGRLTEIKHCVDKVNSKLDNIFIHDPVGRSKNTIELDVIDFKQSDIDFRLRFFLGDGTNDDKL